MPTTNKTTETSDTLTKLYATLSARKRPEDVAQMLLDFPGISWSLKERVVLELAARNSLKRGAWAFSSMADTFFRAAPMDKQVGKAVELFANAPALPASDCGDPAKVEAFLQAIGPQIRKVYGQSDFKADRLNHAARKDVGLDLSRRQYNKRFRLLTRMEDRVGRMVAAIQKYELTLVGKSALASRLPFDEFARDLDTACFVAYLTARANLRSEFTISGQQKAFDQIAEMLLKRCEHNQAANWWAIAHIFPDAVVLAHLTDVQKGKLLGTWFGLLETIANLLCHVYEESDINLVTMVVRRGNDSSTWNQMAGAWNKARDNWIALLSALHMESVLVALCPGKALRLMAADVVAWHRAAGGRLHPDVDVWSELPLPWEVLAGEAPCGRPDVEAACQKAGVDPIKGGWTAPRPSANAATFRPTPELVHGVTITSPFLAQTLRKAGIFSAQSVHPDALSDVLPLTRREENGRVIIDDINENGV